MPSPQPHTVEQPTDSAPRSGVTEEATPSSATEDLAAKPLVRAAIERDTILLLGRRRSGKTVYLATLYNLMWNRNLRQGVTMKALSGSVHMILEGVIAELKAGRWPAANNLVIEQMELEIDDGQNKRLLIALEYGGELFHRAFVLGSEDPECRRFREHVDRAAAVVVLLDAAIATDGEYDERADDHFGMVQAVERIRNWHGGHEVPITVALTKSDQNRTLIKEAGGGALFLKKYYPRLVGTLKKGVVYPVSAVEDLAASNGSAKSGEKSMPKSVEEPILHCLREIRKIEEARRERSAEEARKRAEDERRQAEIDHEKAVVRRSRLRWTLFAIGVIIAFAASIIVPLWWMGKL